MWLIRVEDRVLVHFLYEKCPQYAILSHRWSEVDSEVNFQDMWNYEMASSIRDFEKIWRTCDQAATDNLKYVWIDTCCINKDSSAELSEAINSMYRWYQGATVCYAFLADVECEPGDDNLDAEIASSEWFNRGWTLQELIAPADIVFLNQNWIQLGTKSSLTSILHKRTSIDPAILNGDEPPSNRSIAQRMSWASRRKTTRAEDVAYCLLGIFDVNMPMLYGEGEKAFLRLQEEIIKISDDNSIFAFPLELLPLPVNVSSSTTPRRRLYGLLADSPAAFETCQNVTISQAQSNRTAYAMTNRGLSIELEATLFAVDTYLVRLCCDDSSMPAEGGLASKGPYNLGLFITRLYEDDQFARVAAHDGVSRTRIDYADWDWGHADWDPRSFVDVAGKLNMNVPRRIGRALNTNSTGFDPQRILAYEQGLRFDNRTTSQWKHSQTTYWWNWSGDNMIKFAAQSFYTDGFFGRGDIVLQPDLSNAGKLKFVVFTFDFNSNPVCFVLIDKAKEQPVRPPTSADFEWHLLSRKLKKALLWSQLAGNRRCAVESRSHAGLWAVKGHHRSGIDIHLISADSSEAEQAMHLRMEKSVVENMLVWDVQLYPKQSTQFHKWAVEEMSLRNSRESGNFSLG